MLEPHEERVLDELADLREKHKKLSAFLGTTGFAKLDTTAQVLLRMQSAVMVHYADILEQRINHFGKASEVSDWRRAR